jgi:hypothetical protein
MNESETMHFQTCLACGRKTLIYPNGLCKNCRLLMTLKTVLFKAKRTFKCFDFRLRE